MATETTSPPKTHHDERSSWRSWAKLAIVAAVIAVGASATAFIPRKSTALDPALTHTITRGELLVTVTEQGTLESSNNTEVKCRVRGDNTITWVVESGTEVAEGDVLVRLETLLIEEEISERTKFAHLAKSGVARANADVKRADLAIEEYLQGRYITDLSTLEKNLAVAKSKLLSAKDMLSHSKMMAKSEYKSELEVEEREFAVAQADLDMKLTETNIDVLKRFTKREQLAALNGDLNAAKARYEAEKERAFADEQRLLRAKEELDYCVVTAQRSGMVIYPSGEKWKDAPEIEEGATVHKDQVLLLMPDLTQMRVKVGIHESIIDRLKPGMAARVTLPKATLDAEITTVAAVAKPAGWWTGNVVKYDTIVELPSSDGLKPGMSVEVEVVLARHEDVLMIPTSAVFEAANGHACWIQQDDKPVRRPLQIGDGNDMFLVVESGLAEGDEVILDPLANVKQAQEEAAVALERSTPDKPDLSAL